MSRLTVYAADDRVNILRDTEDQTVIAAELASIGVRFERWAADRQFGAADDQATILDAYRLEIDRLKAEGGYQSADVIKVPRGAANAAQMRAKFLDEHTHGEDEVRFFVEGQGAFYLRHDTLVRRIICTRGDLLSVPAGTRHWFDMGADPELTAIRLFINPDGWVARFTGDAIADRIPRIDG